MPAVKSGLVYLLPAMKCGNVQINQSILSILRLALDLEEINGIVINPFGKYMQVSKAMILLLISIYEENEK